MITLISPAKSQDFSPQSFTKKHSSAHFISDSEKLIPSLLQLSTKEIEQLMNVSEKISELNYNRYRSFDFPFTDKNAKQALLSFTGDVYKAFDFSTFTEHDFDYSQAHLKIISGFYGLLRPLDLIQPYRLEMKIRLQNEFGSNLYKFWGENLSNVLEKELQTHSNPIILNLASTEYFKAINTNALKSKVVTPFFKEKKNDTYKIVAVYAKKARGEMANFIIKNKIDNIDDLKGFSINNYSLNLDLSSENELVYTR